MAGNNYLETVADEYGDVCAKIAELEKRKEEMREELVTFIKDIPVEGLTWTVSKSVSKGRVTLDTKAVREALADTIHQYEKEGAPVTRLIVKPTMRFGETMGEA